MNIVNMFKKIVSKNNKSEKNRKQVAEDYYDLFCYMDKVNEAWRDAVAEAVKAGNITDEQAALIYQIHIMKIISIDK